MILNQLAQWVKDTVAERWRTFSPLEADEKLFAAAITLTFVFYLVGALYLVAPLLGWGSLFMFWIRYSIHERKLNKNTRWLIAVWLGCGLLLQISLVVGHLNFDLGIGKIIKSSIGWAKGWALLSIFITLGFVLNIRYQVICRAACIVGLLAIVITPVLFAAYILKLPDTLYVSPLKILGGSGPEFFTIRLYEIDPFNGRPRWRFFAPWAPAVGFVANIYFLCAWFDKSKVWRCIGLTGNALMILLAVSRMGMIVMLLVPGAVWFLARMTRPWLMVIAAISAIFLALLYEPIFGGIETLLNDIKASRADSTRVRAALGNIALYRWQSEAYWFGHGIVESGTHLVEFMPIGSHHNWYGLLFVKGLIGFLAFLVPFAITTIILLIKAQYQVSSRLALGMCLILGFFSFSENIEALAYMTWPAWLLIGIGLKNPIADIDTNPRNLLGQLRLMSEPTNSEKPS